ncbi:hypothetical protein [Geothrix sp. 21YS21S-4]|uniref:hypothetical protein n=1 Tax=Geothrix sp. 21YS21S-4 TaxID=3068889 RepID=UPI0027B8B340|nr:hypothetical protein [Geothrix sp. 21YS21S-4]
MDVSASNSLTAYAYQSTLSQGGNSGQALTQALASGRSQAAQASSLVASAGPSDATSALAGASGSQALASYAYSSADAAGNGPEAVQSLLSSLGGGTSALLSTDGLPVSAEAISASSTEAQARYAYDQSQNPSATAAQAAAAGQQTQLASGLNLLA